MLDEIKSELPLRNIRVVNMAVNLPAPLAAARLRALGAKVVKVEPPDGDPLREYCPRWYKELTHGQELVRLDLKQTVERADLEKLLSNADLLLTANRPAAIRRLGLGWENLHTQFQFLCQVALTGHGTPRQDLAGHDLTYQARVGLVGPPHMPNTLSADLASAERMVSAALGVLLLREHFRKGFYAEVILENVAADWAAPLRYGLTTRNGILGGGMAQYNLYRARRGWIALAALEPHFSRRLQEELQLETINRKKLALAFRNRTAQHWERWAKARDLPLIAVRNLSKVSLNHRTEGRRK